MKRKLTIIACILTLWLMFPLLAQATPVGKFTNIEGRVDVTSPGKQAVEANVGDSLEAGDIIRTKSKSKAEVAFIDGSILRMAPGSRLRVSEFSQDNGKRNAVLNLFRGKIQNTVQKLTDANAAQSKYEIHTPTSVCGVRGTQFYTYYLSGVSGTVVTEGTVYGYSVNAPDQIRSIGANQTMIVTDPNLPPTVRESTPGETQQHQQDTTLSEKPKKESKEDEGKQPEAGATATDEGQNTGGKKDEGSGEQKQQSESGVKTIGQGEDKAAAANAATNEGSSFVDIVPKEMPALTLQPTTGQNNTQLPITNNDQQATPTTLYIPPPTDSLPPVITAITVPAKLTNTKTTTFIYTTSEPATIKFKVDNQAWITGQQTTDTRFVITLPDLPDGSHTLSLQATDPANNTSVIASYDWAIDTIPPAVIAEPPTTPVNAQTASTITLSSDTDVYSYTIDPGTPTETTGTGTGPTLTIPTATLPDGAHTIIISATDQAGTSAVLPPVTVTIDSTAPIITLAETPPPTTTDRTANIVVSANEPVTYTYTLNGVAVSSPNLSNLPEGQNTFIIDATDPAGNITTETISWTIASGDMTPPVITLAGPASVTNANSATIEVAADEPATYTYTLNGAAVPSPELTNLPEGQNTFIATATDPAGNSATQTFTWTTDYTAPAIALSGTPSAITNASSADIGVTVGENATPIFTLNGAPVAAPTLANLPEGQNTFVVTATDPAGNTATQIFTWTTDYTAPIITLSGTPSAITNASSADIGVTVGENATPIFTLNGAPVALSTLANLPEGQNTFVVTATDPAGNLATKEYTWTTDYTAPIITIAPQALPITDNGTNLTVALSANETATLTTTLGSSVLHDSSPEFINLASGSYTLTVEATDPAGNIFSRTLPFTLDNHAISGNFYGCIGGVYGTATGALAGIDGENWGGWNLTMDGTGNLTPNATWVLSAGGRNADGSHWLDIAPGSTDFTAQTLQGVSHVTYLSRDKLGMGTGEINGQFDGEGNYHLTDISTGSYLEQSLNFVSNIWTDLRDEQNNYDGSLGDALLGGTAPLWTSTATAPVSITLLGAYDPGFGGAHFWNTQIMSNNYYAENDTTYDGGAYFGYLTGIDLPVPVSANGERALRGLISAIYVDDNGLAGLLKMSSPLSGSGYSNIGMFGMTGSLYAEQAAAQNLTISVDGLSSNLYSGYGDGLTAGTLGTDGFFKSDYYGEGSSLSMETLSLVDYDNMLAASWGIFSMTDYGPLANPSIAATDWQAIWGGHSTFGAYWETNPDVYGNLQSYLNANGGYWLAKSSKGTITDTMMTGEFSGRFLTSTTMGQIQGNALGILDSESSRWQMTAVGSWTGTPLLFAGDFYSDLNVTTRYISGSYSYSDGGNYYYSYYADNHSGSLSYNRPAPATGGSSEYYSIQYNADGTYSQYDYNSGITTTGNWRTEGIDSLAFLANPPDAAANPTLNYSENYFTTYGAGSIQGLLGGTDSLWTATQAAPAAITMMGHLTPAAVVSPYLWQTDISSRNYINGTDTTYDGGAYRGFLGGAGTGDTLDGNLIALYVDTNGTTGYLKGDLTGAAHRDLGMFDLDGSLFPTQVATGAGVTPENFHNSVWKTSGNYGLDGITAQATDAAGQITGVWDSAGIINTPINSWMGLFNGGQNFSTLSFVDYDLKKAELWGIYALSSGGEQAGPGATWMDRMGGYNAFGATRVATYYYGDYSYADGGSYSYNYYNDNRSGRINYYRPGVANYYTDYYNDGRTYTYDNLTGTGTYGTWDKAQPLASLAATPLDAGNAQLSSENSYGVADDDYGYWIADIRNGNVSGSRLTGKLEGEFITHTKLGTLAGDAVGVYNPLDNTWQALSGGFWSGTPLSFVSDIHGNLDTVTRYYTGNYTYSDGGNYSYEYYADNRMGYVSYNRTSGESYYINYFANGTYEQFDNNTGIRTTGNWLTAEHDSLAFLATPLDAASNPSPVTNFTELRSYDDGDLNGLMGGTESLWSATAANPAPVILMGDYMSSNKVPHTWTMDISSYNYDNDTSTTYDGGAYQGFLGGAESGGVLDGGLIALYVDPTGKAGFLKSSLAGMAYRNNGMFTLEGEISPTVMSTGIAGVDAQSFYTSIGRQDLWYLTTTDFPVTFATLTETKRNMWINAAPAWGVWQSILQGEGVVDITTGSWAPPSDWSWTTAAYADATCWTSVTWVADTAKLAGNVAGAGADWISATTYVSGGEIKGLFDPVAATWRAVAQGAQMETRQFLQLVSTNPAALQALNIPAIQVGQTNLVGGDGNMTVNMTNVQFFATSVGTAPKIWATDDVSGTYNQAVSPLNQTLNLVGIGGISADFTVKQWNNAANGTWGATVTNGSGVVAGQTIQFQGGAAGRIDTSTTFSGTAAGIVKAP